MVVIEWEIECPFCGGAFIVLIDASVNEQDYIEDCQVCCKPIHFLVKCEEGTVVRVDLSAD